MKLPCSRVVTDFLYGFIGVAVMNATVQLCLYPQLNRLVGADYFGQILFGISVLSIFAISFGCAADNSRLVMRNKCDVSNGDYNLTLMILFAVSAVICFPIFLHILPKENAFLLEALLFFTMLRYYAGVEYRLNLNYRGYLFYYLAISVGYVIGTLLFRQGANWAVALICGEFFGIALVAAFGQIFRPPFFLRSSFKACFGSVAQLSIAGLLNNAVQNLDRILLIFLIGAAANAQYYVASLLGKTLALITIPINSIIIGYLTQSDKRISFADFLKLFVGVCVMSAVFLLGCVLVTPWFAYYFYPDMLEDVKPLVFVASLGQILCFASGILLTVLLTVASEKWQLIVQIIYVISFLGLSIFLGIMSGLYGFTLGVLIANAIRLALVLIICLQSFLMRRKNTLIR